MKLGNYGMALLALTLIGTGVFAAEPNKMDMSKMMTPEMRQKMTDMHQKMADCLRSDKPMSECKQQMMKSCSDSMGKTGCSMMESMHGSSPMKGMSEEENSGTSDEHSKHHPADQ